MVPQTISQSLYRLKRILGWVSLDTLIIILSYLVVLGTRTLTANLNLGDSLAFIALAVIVTILALYINGVYQRIWPQTSGHGSIIILRAIMVSLVILLTIDLLLSPRALPLSVLILSNVITFGGLVVIRYRSRLVGAFRWRWRAVWKGEFPDINSERVLVVGAGESGQALTMRLQHRIDNTKYSVIGFVDDDPQKQHMYVEGKPILGTTEEVAIVAEKYQIGLIIIAIHNIKGTAMRHIIDLCQKTNARIKIVPDMMQLMSSSTIHSQLLRDVKPEDLIGRSIVKPYDGINLESVSKRIIMVTGAAGSIGSELCRQMMNYEPTRLIMLDNNESALHNLYIDLKAQYPDADLVPSLSDVTRYADMNVIFGNHYPQIVFHAAAYKHVPMLERYPNESVRVNVNGTFNIAELARIHNVERFVLVSTDKAVEPSSVMGASKRLCELIIHSLAQQENAKTLFTAVRFGNVLGSRGSVVPTFTRQIEEGRPITVTHEDMTRFFMSVSEAVNLIIHAAAMTLGNDIFVLRMGEKVRILDIAERMIRLRGLRPHIDVKIDFIGVRNGEKMHEELHSYYEKPLDTQHPKVMKLDNCMMNGYASIFIENVAYLIRHGIPDDTDALEHLLKLCQMGESSHV